MLSILLNKRFNKEEKNYKREIFRAKTVANQLR